MEGLELFAGLDAHLRREALPGLAIGLERFRLTPGAIEGRHELAGESLARRILRDHAPKLRDELVVATGRQVRVHTSLDRSLVLLLEPRDLDLRERLEGQIRERLPAPEAQRLAQGRAGLFGLARGQGTPPVVHQALEALGVELSRSDA